MTDIATLGMSVDTRQLASATAALNEFAKAAKAAQSASGGFATGASSVSSVASAFNAALRSVGTGLGSFTSSLFTARNAFKGFVAILAIDQFAKLSDSYNNLYSRIGLVTKSADEQSAVFNGLFAIADKTGSSVELLGDQYVKISTGIRSFGLSAGDTLNVMQSLSEAIQISGASSLQAQRGLTDLAEGMAAGSLQGRQLRAALMQVPGVLSALEDGLHLTRAQLVQLSETGQLTTAKVFEGLIADTQKLDAQFAQMPTTVARASTTLHNDFLKVVGSVNLTAGGTQSFVKVLQSLDQTISSPDFASGMTVLVTGVAKMASAIADLVAEAGKAEHSKMLPLILGAAGAYAGGRIAGPYGALFGGAAGLGAGAGIYFSPSEKSDLPALNWNSFNDENKQFGMGGYQSPEIARQIESQIAAIDKSKNALIAQAAAFGMSTGAATAYEKIMEVTNFATDNGTTLTDEQRRKLADYAKQLGDVAQAYAELKATQDAVFAGSQLGRSPMEQDVASTLRGIYGDQWETQVSGAIAAQIRFNDVLKDTQDTANSFASDFISDMRQGKTVTDSLTDAFNNLTTQILQAVANREIDSFIAAVFQGTAAPGGGGIFSSLFGSGASTVSGPLGWLTQVKPGAADGGFLSGPGSGTSDSIWIRASNGEHITNARSAAKHRDLLEAINADRYASGGFVGRGASSALLPNVDVNVNVVNKTDAHVQVQQKPNASGGIDLEVMIDNIVAKKLAQPGSATNRTLGKQFGVKQQLTRRS